MSRSPLTNGVDEKRTPSFTSYSPSTPPLASLNPDHHHHAASFMRNPNPNPNPNPHADPLSLQQGPISSEAETVTTSRTTTASSDTRSTSTSTNSSVHPFEHTVRGATIPIHSSLPPLQEPRPWVGTPLYPTFHRSLDHLLCLREDTIEVLATYLNRDRRQRSTTPCQEMIGPTVTSSSVEGNDPNHNHHHHHEHDDTKTKKRPLQQLDTRHEASSFPTRGDHTLTPTSLTTASSCNRLARLSTSVTRGDVLKSEMSGEWGWFADIDSSGESPQLSIHGESSRLLTQLGLSSTTATAALLGSASSRVVSSHSRPRGTTPRVAASFQNERQVAAHKTFAWSEEEAHDELSSSPPHPTTPYTTKRPLSQRLRRRPSKIVTASISIPKFRIVQTKAGADRHAEYEVTFALGSCFYSDWRRYSEFEAIMTQKGVGSDDFPRTHGAWKQIDTRWFNRLEPSYLHRKCIALEKLMREMMYESLRPHLLLAFCGGPGAKVNAPPPRQTDDPSNDVVSQDRRLLTSASEASTITRPSAQLPKDMRPAQPPQERELFEKLWAENFKRSMVPLT